MRVCCVRTLGLTVIILATLAAAAAAQQIPPPTGPVVFCGSQAPPAPESYTVAVDEGTPVAVAMEATVNPACPAGSTHSFALAPASFPIGPHHVQVFSRNSFGTTAGPSFAVTVGIAPGAFTITGVIPPPGD